MDVICSSGASALAQIVDVFYLNFRKNAISHFHQNSININWMPKYTINLLN